MVLGHRQAGLVAVQQLQALAGVGQADAGAGGGGAAEAQTGVGHLHHQLAVLDVGADAQEGSTLRLGLQAMLDGVFDEALDDHGRELGRQQPLGHVELGRQPLLHAHLQDLQIGPHHRHLAAQVAQAGPPRR